MLKIELMENIVVYKLNKIFSSVSVIGLCILSQTAVAAPITGTVTDEYWGADDHGYGDVIGADSKFQIFSVDYSLDGTDLEITVNTNFANNGLGSYSSLTNLDPNGGSNTDTTPGISFGDLFLSSSWTPDTTTANYLSDDMSTGTDWDYGFALDNRWSPTGGSGDWYDLTSMDNASSIYSSDDFLSGGVWRNNQEVAVNTSAATGNILSTTTWSVNPGSPGEVVFNFDISGTTLETSDTIAFHWAMSCGNDTIEGKFNKPVSAPEPATLALFSLGLLGLFRKRISKKIAA